MKPLLVYFSLSSSREHSSITEVYYVLLPALMTLTPQSSSPTP